MSGGVHFARAVALGLLGWGAFPNVARAAFVDCTVDDVKHASTPRAIDLSAEGDFDWVHLGDDSSDPSRFPLTTPLPLDRKFGVGLLSVETLTASEPPLERDVSTSSSSWARSVSSELAFSWTDGQPSQKAQGLQSGVAITAPSVATEPQSAGFRVRIAARPEGVALQLYFGCNDGAKADLIAWYPARTSCETSLSDGEHIASLGFRGESTEELTVDLVRSGVSGSAVDGGQLALYAVSARKRAFQLPTPPPPAPESPMACTLSSPAGVGAGSQGGASLALLGALALWRRARD